MAYGIKYQCEWVSPMRDNHEYIISILERDYTGEVHKLHPTGDVLTITQGQRGASELTPFRTSEAELTLLCLEDGSPYISLFSTDPTRHILRVMRRAYSLDGVAKEMHEWSGFLTPATYVETYGKVPYEVSLRASDGIALLKDVPFADIDGSRYAGRMSLNSIVTSILAKLPNGFSVSMLADDNVVIPAQQEPSLQLMGVDVEALYNMLGGDSMPSCYDVLETILRSLQLQLFQGYGAWHIRTVGALTGVERGTLNILPLYSDADDGVGVSVDATLSLLAPYRKLNIQRPELQAITEGGAYPQALNKYMWTPAFGGVKMTTYARKGRLVRLKASRLKKSKSEDIGCALLTDIVFERSKQTTLSISFDAYNLHVKKKQMRIMLLAYDAQSSIVDKLFEPSTTAIVVGLPLAYWSADKEKWITVAEGPYRQPSETAVPSQEYPFIDGAWHSVALPEAPRINYFDRPVPTSYMGHTEVTISVSNMDVNVAQAMRLAVVIAGPHDESLSSIELRNPEIVFTDNVEGIEDVDFNEALISTAGLEDIAFEQTLADAWVRPTSGHTYQVPLINMVTGAQLRGLIAPQQRALIADTAVYNLRKLRGGITRQLEGYIYVKTRVDMNTRWRDRAGRLYYTNYVRRLLNRGVYKVELREMPSAPTVHVAPIFGEGVSSIVGLDTRVYWLNELGDSIDTYDTMTGEASNVLLATRNEPLTLNEGQRCACVIESVYNDEEGTTDYVLRAFDTEGAMISEIDGIRSLVGAEVAGFDTMARSARYDANIGMWFLIGSTTKGTELALITRDGEVAGRTSYTVGNYLRVTDSALIPNGFVFTTHPATTGAFYSWWHSNTEHANAAVSEHGEGISIVAVNEAFVLKKYISANITSLYTRNDAQLGHDITPLIEVRGDEFEFVAMNNALVVFQERVSGDSRVRVYDARTGNIIDIMTRATAIVWLSGDIVYTAVPHDTIEDGYTIVGTRIVLGDKNHVEYKVYIDKNGATYQTRSVETYRVKHVYE